MKNIGITDGFGREGVLISDFFKHIQGRNQDFNFFAIDWESFNLEGNFRSVDLRSGLEETVNVRNLDLLHVLFLGNVANKWDYFHGFLDLADSFNVDVINPVETIKYSIDKKYLLDLQEDLPMIKTIAIPSDVDLRGLRACAGDSYGVVKPLNGECGLLVNRVSEITDQTLREYRSLTDTLLLQPFVEGISQGERHLIYLGDNFSHAVMKTPRNGEFKINSSAGSSAVSYSPTREEIEIGYDVKRKFKHSLTAYRVDLVSTKEGPKIMEIEAVNPSYHAETVGIEKAQAERLGQFYRDYFPEGLER